MNVLILEDNPERMKQFKRALIGKIIYHAKTPREAIAFLRSNQIDVAFLDHDLGGTGEPETPGEDTGWWVARWLKNHPQFMPNQVIIHSLNHAASKLMKAALPNAEIVPFAWTKI